jgi:hypothetical protein
VDHIIRPLETLEAVVPKGEDDVVDIGVKL